ncbi:helix-turn-helix transcriptional regulator [Roseovarius sp. EL26]|uniref:ArsR/SmtB family transcription factor n=1 Tax=Roseovarius sp. EL26 TaxID=2126672 RepID=UPI000EA13F03|nr:metalloregulator ArsR/SmtB family transcription factor [Roseovarius sp. EL26]
MSTLPALKALSNEKRLQIMRWIAAPVDHFPAQTDGDLVEDGVCVQSITEKIGLTQPTVTSHMRVLEKAGLVTSRQIKNWVFYKPNRTAIAAALDDLSMTLLR